MTGEGLDRRPHRASAHETLRTRRQHEAHQLPRPGRETDVHRLGDAAPALAAQREHDAVAATPLAAAPCGCRSSAGSSASRQATRSAARSRSPISAARPTVVRCVPARFVVMSDCSGCWRSASASTPSCSATVAQPAIGTTCGRGSAGDAHHRCSMPRSFSSSSTEAVSLGRIARTDPPAEHKPTKGTTATSAVSGRVASALALRAGGRRV